MPSQTGSLSLSLRQPMMRRARERERESRWLQSHLTEVDRLVTSQVVGTTDTRPTHSLPLLRSHCTHTASCLTHALSLSLSNCTREARAAGEAAIAGQTSLLQGGGASVCVCCTSSDLSTFSPPFHLISQLNCFFHLNFLPFD